MLEKTLEKILIKKVKNLGGMSLKFNSSIRGAPDRIIIWKNGTVDFVEIKTESGILSPLQKSMIQKLKSNNANVYVVFGKHSLEEYLNGKIHTS